MGFVNQFWIFHFNFIHNLSLELKIRKIKSPIKIGLSELSRLSKKIRHRVLTDQTLCRICFPPVKWSTKLFHFTTLWWFCQSPFENPFLKSETLYYLYKQNPWISTFHHAKDQNTVLKFSGKYSIIFLLFEHRTAFSSRIPWSLHDLNEKFYT